MVTLVKRLRAGIAVLCRGVLRWHVNRGRHLPAGHDTVMAAYIPRHKERTRVCWLPATYCLAGSENPTDVATIQRKIWPTIFKARSHQVSDESLGYGLHSPCGHYYFTMHVSEARADFPEPGHVSVTQISQRRQLDRKMLRPLRGQGPSK